MIPDIKTRGMILKQKTWEAISYAFRYARKKEFAAAHALFTQAVNERDLRDTPRVLLCIAIGYVRVGNVKRAADILSELKEINVPKAAMLLDAIQKTGSIDFDPVPPKRELSFSKSEEPELKNYREKRKPRNSIRSAAIKEGRCRITKEANGKFLDVFSRFGIVQADVCRSTGIKSAMLSNYLNAYIDISVSDLKKILAYFRDHGVPEQVIQDICSFISVPSSTELNL